MMRQYELVERVTKYDPDVDEDLLNRAYVYAMKAHGNQKRASGEAYFNHPLEVAAILTEMKLDSATIAAALLHDLLLELPGDEVHRLDGCLPNTRREKEGRERGEKRSQNNGWG